jgi:hypothetical protein
MKPYRHCPAIVPYTTPSSLRIGSAWTPAPARMSDDAIAIQRALIDPVTERGHSTVLWVGVVILCVLAVAAIAGA